MLGQAGQHSTREKERTGSQSNAFAEAQRGFVPISTFITWIRKLQLQAPDNNFVVTAFAQHIAWHWFCVVSASVLYICYDAFAVHTFSTARIIY